MADEHVDYRYLLANERTFLAYLRTALALQVAGLAVLQFLTRGHAALRLELGLALVVVGSYVGLVGFLRWRSNERAIRSGGPMQSSRATWVIAVAVVAIPLVAAVVFTLT
jgi:putative membrane protein